MKDIELFVSRSVVWDEVMKTTEYIGAKLLSETDVYDSSRMTEDDVALFGRSWIEAVLVVDTLLQEWLHDRYNGADGYLAVLRVADGYDDAMTASMNECLTSYFVGVLCAKWIRFTNQDEAEKWVTSAKGMLDEALRLLYSRVRPCRKEVEVQE